VNDERLGATVTKNKTGFVGLKVPVQRLRAIIKRCPLLGVKRTSRFNEVMSAYDPKRTSAGQSCCDATRLNAVVGYSAPADWRQTEHFIAWTARHRPHMTDNM
jgi:hypothetical protein